MSRQRDESIMIGDNIEVIIVDVRGDKVRLGITFPKHIPVHRREIYDAIQREKEREKAKKSEKKTVEDKAETKAGEELLFCCNGVYGSNITEQNAYLRVSQSGEKKLDCESLHKEGYCCFGATAYQPLTALKKCLLGIEKFLG